MPEFFVPRKKTRQPTKRRPGTSGWRFVFYAVALACLAIVTVRALLVDIFYIPSGSMEPLLGAGDRVLVSRTDYVFGEIKRGDVVVFDGRGSFAPLGPGGFEQALTDTMRFFGVGDTETVYVKRVVGVGGDLVACCDSSGRVTINGNALEEPYVFPMNAPSEMKFEVAVPEGKLWLMGDHRSESFDSRSLLGAPGGGLVSEERVIGRAISVVWPPVDAATIPRPAGAP
ncbi:signal peptidase I [Arthrobacter tecti]